jgi:hypothetical protein
VPRPAPRCARDQPDVPAIIVRPSLSRSPHGSSVVNDTPLLRRPAPARQRGIPASKAHIRPHSLLTLRARPSPEPRTSRGASTESKALVPAPPAPQRPASRAGPPRVVSVRPTSALPRTRLFTLPAPGPALPAMPARPARCPAGYGSAQRSSHSTAQSPPRPPSPRGPLALRPPPERQRAVANHAGLDSMFARPEHKRRVRSPMLTPLPHHRSSCERRAIGRSRQLPIAWSSRHLRDNARPGQGRPAHAPASSSLDVTEW